MKRLGNLYEQIIDYENLWEAYLNARKGKRFRGEVLEFSNNLEENLIQIQNELIYKTYEIGRYREFHVYEPKKRLIMSLPFKDRVVQWAIYKVLEPYFDRQFISDSFACRKGKGSQQAASRVQYWIRKVERTGARPYHLKCDVSKYFYRIDHQVLLSMLQRKIKDDDLMWLLEKIICSEDVNFGVPLMDHQFEEDRIEGMGMPIGNLTSQLFANLYLNELDQFVKHKLKIKYYARYMDDMVIIDNDKQNLNAILEDMDLFLRFDLKLLLNNKTAIRPTSDGVDFVGFRIWSTHKKLKKKTVKKMKKRLKYLQKAYARGEVELEHIKPTIASYLGLMKHADCHKLKTKLLNDFVLTRGAH
ncbi:RNA-directed DNA polymerase [Alkalihalobacillus alcalophilus ATCC 27647 = CGMCC 1.3604]|uniref:DNA polymerase n=1 Tax=Alkalihalobacillus alcalophilus ATCC 27647 = CGMCC 1.3604 TaxID=1218173 RepID=A0A094XDM7_ALKAL|nr:reverse transcriptase/maturase family protein [Alkalihalobacillus alcalophilus]YP_009276859.1 Reverse transcriptase [Bacillus phage BalMu-1]AJA42487.1 retron-type RNA-directed DNA polymerase [Bacillus phage BalMu-1]KGA96880.1 DNA polymerase [Alkalihalobacillus alcalophilus ATCC 27647 = CGMCC 1.3604]MED1561172.1 reverse transcriptase/maturase family protein [Alkalihalobacillus alcalophilus]THG88721.1 RNA-directed DNA polymerase [Alkalihalobacillus alcalophilus ATCC 27647 = CGMCC 1.3604]